MRVTREQAQENHARIIDTAAGLLREKGYDGIGVAALMKAAGLTHGGFYNNFASKDDLIAKATEAALHSSRDALMTAQASVGGDPFRALVASYLSPRHAGQTANGCILPALAADAARRDDPALHAVFAEAIEVYQQHLGRIMPADLPPRAPEAVLAQLVGAVVLSRVLGEGDRATAFLDAVAGDLAPAPAVT